MEQIEQLEKHIESLEKQTRKMEQHLRVVMEALRNSAQAIANPINLDKLDRIISDNAKKTQKAKTSKKITEA